MSESPEAETAAENRFRALPFRVLSSRGVGTSAGDSGRDGLSLQRPQNVGKALAGLRTGPLETEAFSSLGLSFAPSSDVLYITGLQWTDWGGSTQ